MYERVGTVIHGALGDCYEQILCLLIYKKNNPEIKLIGFFAVNNRRIAFSHFDLSVFDEIYGHESIGHVQIDRYYQFQFFDVELQANIIEKLNKDELLKFDKHVNLLPWKVLKSFDFYTQPLHLGLSEKGCEYLDFVKKLHRIKIDENKLNVGFLWRYRKKGINAKGQYSKNTVKKNICDLLRYLIDEYNAYIYVCGMGAGNLKDLECFNRVVEEGGVALGEHRWKFEEDYLDLPSNRVTYLMGTGYAAEMEIMAQCDLLVTMPSGFSEPLYMRDPKKVIMVFPPYEYLARIWRHNMPLFDNCTFQGKIYNTFTFHSKKNILKFLNKKNKHLFECDLGVVDA